MSPEPYLLPTYCHNTYYSTPPSIDSTNILSYTYHPEPTPISTLILQRDTYPSLQPQQDEGRHPPPFGAGTVQYPSAVLLSDCKIRQPHKQCEVISHSGDHERPLASGSPVSQEAIGLATREAASLFCPPLVTDPLRLLIFCAFEAMHLHSFGAREP